MTTLLTQKFWSIKNPDPLRQVQLCNALNLHPIIGRLLINRGIKTVAEAQQFLSTGLAGLHDPFLLTDMEAAVRRIRRALQKKERVLIFGDYDVDGLTSIAVLQTVLRQMGMDVIHHIPHRMHDGYGLNGEIGHVLEKKGVGLLIAVDCGVTAVQEVKDINKLGVDVIILDHHEPAPDGLPPALAVVDPKRADCPYPFKHLAAVGLVGKLIQALDPKFLEPYLDLIALGTIADVVPLQGENRIFVKEGLPRLTHTANKGLAALMEKAGIRAKAFKPYYAGFILGPRLNASGRLGSAQKSLDLLLTEDVDEARQLADLLEEINQDRQKLQRKIIQDAFELVEQEINFNEETVIVVGKEGWHKGVLGIVASRVAETYYRPTIVISWEDGIGTASARSIEGFHLNEALAHCSEFLENFGGHRLAAGLTIREERIHEFRNKINAFAKEILQIRDLIPCLNIDGEVPLSGLSLDLAEKIDSLEPYGEGNPSPVFCSRRLTVKSVPMVMGKETIKFWVTDGETTASAVGFGMAKYKDIIRLGEKIDLAYRLIIDDWNKAPSVQLKLEDIKISEL